MKILISVVAGALMGVSAVAGKQEPVAETEFQVRSGATAAADVTAIGPVVEALRSGEATYAGIRRSSRADYVPLRPPL